MSSQAIFKIVKILYMSNYKKCQLNIIAFAIRLFLISIFLVIVACHASYAIKLIQKVNKFRKLELTKEQCVHHRLRESRTFAVNYPVQLCGRAFAPATVIGRTAAIGLQFNCTYTRKKRFRVIRSLMLSAIVVNERVEPTTVFYEF